jgi:pyruvate kinase
VYPVHLAEDPDNWRKFVADFVRGHGLHRAIAMLVAGPSPRNPDANHRIEFLLTAKEKP